MLELNDINIKNKTPMSIEAEQALLGAILINNRELEKVSEILQPIHFADKVHSKIYEACVKMIERGHVADPITLNDYFSSLGESNDIGKDYLIRLATSNVSGVNIAGYAQLIYDRALRRELINIGQNIVENALTDNLENPASKQIEEAEQFLYDVAITGTAEGDLKTFKQTLGEALQSTEYALKNKGGISGISSGLRDMDKVLGGLNPSDLLIVAGRPGMGKTVLALNVAFNMANEVYNKRSPEKMTGPCCFFSLEMSADQLAARLLSMNAEVEGHKLRKGSITTEEFARLAEISRALEEIPLFIDDTPGIKISAIRTRCRRLKRLHGSLSGIVIDYLQLLTPSGRQRENRVQELSAMTRDLKILAKEMDCPVVVLSQLSRQVEQREDKRPVLSDLRESGSIEQDADIVMFVYRENYYIAQQEPTAENSDNFEEEMQKWKSRMERTKNRASVIIGKNRHGEAKTIKLFANMAYSKLGDLAVQYEEE
jgi:replicative DNA helicase